MSKKFVKNPLFIVTIFVVSALVGIAVIFIYKQSNTSDLTASIKSPDLNQTDEVGEIDKLNQTEPEADSQPQPTIQPQIQEEPKVVSKPKVASPAPVKETAPDIQSALGVIVSPSSVKAGESVTITVPTPGFEDLSSVSFIDVYLESRTGLSTARGSIVNIDGEGRRFGSIAIPKDAELGTWTIKTVQIFDNTGGITSYHYGTDIFTTFTVIAS